MAENPIPPVVPQLTLPVPQRKDPTNFRQRADILMTELPLVVDGINAASVYVQGAKMDVASNRDQTYAAAGDAESAAQRAAQSSMVADVAKIEAEQSRDAAQTAAAAASASAGLPSLAGNGGKVLTVRTQEDGVEWSPFGLVAVEITSHSIPDQMLPDFTKTLSFAAKPYLVDATISHFVFNIDGMDNDIPAVSNQATFDYENNHTEGTATRWTLVAIDNLGNSSVELSGIIEFTSAAEYIKTPVITSPKDGAINVPESPIIEWQPMEVHGGSDTHTGTTVRITDSVGAVVYEEEVGVGLSHETPSGVLHDGKSKYFLDIKFHGSQLGSSPWSPKISFTTEEQFSIVFGVALVEPGGNGGTFVYLDRGGNVVQRTQSDFNAHPVWGGIQDVRIDSQYMVKIPKFYVKYEERIVAPAVEPVPCWFVADKPAEGFELYPAFFKNGQEIDQFYVGKYQASLASGKLRSIPGVLPVVSRSITQFIADAKARNTGGVEGFMIWSPYQWSAIQWLYLVENKTMDSQAKTGQGRVNATSAAAVDAADVAQATYRGVVGLWGNVREWVDGMRVNDGVIFLWDLIGNETYVNTGEKRQAGGGTIYPTSFMLSAGVDFNFSHFFIGDNGPSANSNAVAPDYQYMSFSGEHAVDTGGPYSGGGGAGLWHMHANYGLNNKENRIGGRITKI